MCYETQDPFQHFSCRESSLIDIPNKLYTEEVSGHATLANKNRLVIFILLVPSLKARILYCKSRLFYQTTFSHIFLPKYKHVHVWRSNMGVVALRLRQWFAPSQWETSLQSNAVSHWLGAMYTLCFVHWISVTSIGLFSLWVDSSSAWWSRLGAMGIL